MFTPCDINPRMDSVFAKIEAVEFKIKNNKKSATYSVDLEIILTKKLNGLKKRKGELIQESMKWAEFDDSDFTDEE